MGDANNDRGCNSSIQVQEQTTIGEGEEHILGELQGRSGFANRSDATKVTPQPADTRVESSKDMATPWPINKRGNLTEAQKRMASILRQMGAYVDLTAEEYPLLVGDSPNILRTSMAASEEIGSAATAHREARSRYVKEDRVWNRFGIRDLFSWILFMAEKKTGFAATGFRHARSRGVNDYISIVDLGGRELNIWSNFMEAQEREVAASSGEVGSQIVKHSSSINDFGVRDLASWSFFMPIPPSSRFGVRDLASWARFMKSLPATPARQGTFLDNHEEYSTLEVADEIMGTDNENTNASHGEISDTSNDVKHLDEGKKGTEEQAPEDQDISLDTLAPTDQTQTQKKTHGLPKTNKPSNDMRLTPYEKWLAEMSGKDADSELDLRHTN